ncbi:MAG: lamin tail domain-containing protein [Patescibacteria group bacterium]
MLQISEWVPNPKGVDTQSEWIEFQNTGTASLNTAGWFLKNEKGARISLPAKTLGPGEFLTIGRPQYKVAFRNTNGGVALYNPAGQKVDEASFLGTAPEGKAFAAPRRSFSEGGIANDNTNKRFSWIQPTKDATNTEAVVLAQSNFPIGIPLNPPQLPFASLALFPILITGFVLYTVKQDEVLSNLLFGGNQDIRENEALAYTLIEETPPDDFVSSGQAENGYNSRSNR